jgi:hypoxanthine phosphoribosyltransferase
MDGDYKKWRDNIDVLMSAEQIAKRNQELGKAITESYPAGTELCVVGVLKGSFLFYADLVRHIELPLHCEFIGISSYGDETKSSGVVKITSDLSTSIQGRDVLIIEDIIDTGLTMKYLLENFETRQPKSIKVCTLLDKPASHKDIIPIDFTGFTCPDAFVVGYGLDYASKLRNLPFIGVYHGDT